MSTLPKIIAVDFDGTLFENAWPDVGAPIEKNINKLKAEQADGAKVILWTNRVGGALDKAVNFCKEHGIHLDAVNENLPEIVQGFGTDCRKIFANEYWDDHAVWMSKQDIGEFSDGFHTFNSLYHQRLILFAALVNTFPSLAWKSRKHSDGEVPFGGGWFIVGVDTPKGPYTYHYEDKDWDLFHCREIETAPEWDGHTDKDVERVLSLTDDDESDWAAREVALASQKKRESAEDVIDEQSGSGKLDLIIQLPYVIKTDARRQQAEKRRKDIEDQLSGSKYGIAYTDGTERITQLNRSVENNLMHQIEYLTSMLYSQLGITQEIMDGTADDKTMLNYYSRTIEPFVSAIADEMKRKFLTKTARSQFQSIAFFRDPFKLVPVSELAEIADKFTRNEILSPNEMRQIIGLKPSADPKADELRNRNVSEANGSEAAKAPTEETTDNNQTEGGNSK